MGRLAAGRESAHAALACGALEGEGMRAGEAEAEAEAEADADADAEVGMGPGMGADPAVRMFRDGGFWYVGMEALGCMAHVGADRASGRPAAA